MCAPSIKLLSFANTPIKTALSSSSPRYSWDDTIFLFSWNFMAVLYFDTKLKWIHSKVISLFKLWGKINGQTNSSRESMEFYGIIKCHPPKNILKIKGHSKYMSTWNTMQWLLQPSRQYEDIMNFGTGSKIRCTLSMLICHGTIFCTLHF